jgi:hypothetical protein
MEGLGKFSQNPKGQILNTGRGQSKNGTRKKIRCRNDD